MTGTQRAKPVGEHRTPNFQLKALRFEAGLSQRGLAYQAGLTYGVVQLAEKGWTPHPSNAGKILEALERKLDREVRYVEVWPLPGEGRRRCAS
jgi:predicted transcriptional regulator